MVFEVLFDAFVKRHLPLAFVTAVCLLPLHSATLERLSLGEMATKSTAIERARVVGSYASTAGAVIYTHYKLQVGELLKGQGVAEVVVPGGTANGIQQMVPGAPRFNKGDEYVFFLWTGPDGLSRVIGLTQGMFAVAQDGSANPAVTRAASQELMLDARTRRPVKDQTLSMRMSDLRSQISGALAAGAAQK